MFAFFGAPGPLELIIIAGVMLIPTAIVVALVVALTHGRKTCVRSANPMVTCIGRGPGRA